MENKLDKILASQKVRISRVGNVDMEDFINKVVKPLNVIKYIAELECEVLYSKTRSYIRKDDCVDILETMSKDSLNNLMRKSEQIYDEETLQRLNNCEVVYMAYIGVYEGENLYKYGVTKKIVKRFSTHRGHFDIFDPVFVGKADNYEKVEGVFEEYVTERKIIRNFPYKETNYIEIFTSDDYMIELDFLKNLPFVWKK